MKPFNYYQNPQVLQISPETVLAYKPLGWTPLEVIKYLQQKEFSNEKLGYAGRLDPMAEGLLLLLRGDENKNKVKYEKLDKTYLFTCTFGVKTDTLDVLGAITNVRTDHQNNTFSTALQDKLSSLQGDIDLQYPIYSAKRVKGKPLYHWALRNKLQEINIPTTTVNVFSINLDRIYQSTGGELAEEALNRVNKVKGDFRQEDIINGWNNFASKYGDNNFVSADIIAEVSAGTYIRSLCERLGSEMGTVAIATNIHRIALGNYTY